MSSEFGWVALRGLVSEITELYTCEKSLELARQVKNLSEHFSEVNATSYYTSVSAVDDYIQFLEDWQKYVMDELLLRYEQVRRDYPEISSSTQTQTYTNSYGDTYTLAFNVDKNVRIIYKDKMYKVFWGVQSESFVVDITG